MCDPGNSTEILKEVTANPEIHQYYRGDRWRKETSNMDIIKFISTIDFKLIKWLNILGG